MTKPSLTELCSLLRRIATDEVIGRFNKIGHQIKTDGTLVTQADLAVQRRVEEQLRERWPELPLLGEEMSVEQQRHILNDSDAGFWCLDPLDGTSNFVSGFPYFSLSLAYFQSGEAEMGVVFDPVRDECFSAQRNAGAFIDGAPMRLTIPRLQLCDCLAVVDFKRLDTRRAQRLARNAPYRSQRNLGSVALEWSWLAAGRFQLYLHGGQKLWDYAAGRLILREAGGAEYLSGSEANNGDAEHLDLLLPRAAVAAVDAELLDDWRVWLDSNEH